jgi:hypothetical protein
MREYCSSLKALAGWRFTVFLVVVYAGGKGGGATFLEMALLPLFKDVLAVSSAVYQQSRIVVFLPFALKPAIGTLVDTFGLARAISCATLAAAAGASIAGSYLEPSRELATAVGFACVLGVAASDVVAEGKYATAMRLMPEAGSLFVTLVWAVIFISRMVAAGVCSIVFVRAPTPYKVLLAVSGTLFAAAATPFASGWHAPQVPLAPLQMQPVTAPARTATLALLMTISACSVAALTFGTLSAEIQLLLIVIIASLLLGSARQCVPRPLWKCMLYLFASAALYVDVSALDYFYTSDCVVDGPQFSYAYYLSASSVVSSIFGACAAVLFQTHFQEWSFRQCVALGTVAKCTGSLVDIALVNRWNVGHVSDAVLFLLGNCGLRSLVAMLDALPMVVLVSRLAIPGAETTTYALLAGLQNLGSTTSLAAGIALADVYNVSISAQACNYDNLAALVLTCQCVLPLATLCFLPLLPKATMREPLPG